MTFATTASETPYMTDLNSCGVSCVQIELNNSSFDLFLSDLEPEIVVFDRFMMEEQFGWRVSHVCPAALKILDTEDLHFLRDLRKNATKNPTEYPLEYRHSELSKREIASIYRCDISLIISQIEMKVLMQQYAVPEHLLLYLPFMEAPEEYDDIPAFADRVDFVSIGNFLHKPNWDAVLNLKENIWPLIRKMLPGVQLHVYGAYASQKVLQLHNVKEGFLVHGRTPSAHEVIARSRVLLAPLRYGAGLKGKFIDAIQAGTPFITTSVGGEGMVPDSLWDQVVKDDYSSFAEAAVKLYKSPDLWSRTQQEGFRLIQNQFSKEKFSEIFRSKIKYLVENLSAHRRSNFTGAMLQHHQMASTKYLSKYIEMKNLVEAGNKKRPTSGRFDPNK